jgi:hypothetical protein
MTERLPRRKRRAPGIVAVSDPVVKEPPSMVRGWWRVVVAPTMKVCSGLSVDRPPSDAYEETGRKSVYWRVPALQRYCPRRCCMLVTRSVPPV